MIGMAGWGLAGPQRGLGGLVRASEATTLPLSPGPQAQAPGWPVGAELAIIVVCIVALCGTLWYLFLYDEPLNDRSILDEYEDQYEDE